MKKDVILGSSIKGGGTWTNKLEDIISFNTKTGI